MSVNNKLILDILIDGVPYPMVSESVQTLQITSSILYQVPLLRLTIIDIGNLFRTALPLVDGTSILIKIGIHDGSIAEYPFRVFSFERQQSSGALVYTIDGYYNAVRYFVGSTTDAYKGSSSDALFKLATKCGLKDDLDSTSDPQVWYGSNKRHCVWAKEIADYGYVNDSSCMVLALTESGILRYKNIAKFKWDKAMVLSQLGTGFPIIDRSVLNKAGLNNIYDGYGSVFEEQSVTTVGAIHKDTLHTRVSNNTLLNPDFAMKSRVRIGPVNGGNVHKNFFKANYQNKRVQNRFNIGISTLHNLPTGLSILEPVTLDLADAQNVKDNIYSGNYIITGKTVYTKGLDFYEKLEMYSDGINETFTKQVT